MCLILRVQSVGGALRPDTERPRNSSGRKTPPTPVPMSREVSIRNAHSRLKIPRGAIARAVAELDAQAPDFLGGCPAGELSVVFLTDPALAKIHADFMDDPTATDVITFEGDPVASLAGEICVSADTAARYVGLLEGRSPDRPRSVRKPTLQDNFAAELTLYVVHGWLHLAGYDDLQPAKKRQMRATEARAMKLLVAAKAIPAFRLK